MTPDIQHIKAKIITALDFLPLESLNLLAEFVTFLRTKAHYHPADTVDIQSSPPDLPEDPIFQLGTHPIVEDIIDASTNHDSYLYNS